MAYRLNKNSWVYFIDAKTGEIIYKYNDNKTVLTRAVYTGGSSSPTLPGTLVISEGDDTSIITDDDAVEAYNYSEDVYDYYNKNFGLLSFNGEDYSMVSTVDYDFSIFSSGGDCGMWWLSFRIRAVI